MVERIENDAECIGKGGSMKLSVVGIGPGRAEDMTFRAYRAVEAAELVVGYGLYNELLKESFPDKEYFESPMRRESERCEYALKKASEGVNTVLVCSGDSGIYGMASLVMEIKEMNPEFADVDIQVIPGITAAVSGGALLGSPLTCDFCVISLSDLLTPMDVIEKRVRAAAQGGLATVLYNPGSKKRREHLRRVCDIMLECRKPETVCGIAGNIGREGEYFRILTLGELRETEADMFMTVFIGCENTRVIDGRMVTPRGYVERGRVEKCSITECAVEAVAEVAAGKAYEKKNDCSMREDAGTEMYDMAEKRTGNVRNDCEMLKGTGAVEREVSEKKSSSGKSRFEMTEDGEAGVHRCSDVRILIFGGTTEGRELAVEAAKIGIDTVLCVATEYGEEVVSAEISGFSGDTNEKDWSEEVCVAAGLSGDGCELSAGSHGAGKNLSELLTVKRGRLSEAEMAELMRGGRFEAVIDATHPYASEVTAKVSRAAAETGSRYIRVRREIAAAPVPEIIFVPDVESAASLLNRTDERVFVTAGSRSAAAFGSVKGAADRITMRILPSAEALDKCRAAGFAGKNLICMQGPFSRDINEAMFRATASETLVTKSAGKAGGFREKIDAAAALGMKIIVIMPPEDIPGITPQQAMEYINSLKNQ